MKSINRLFQRGSKNISPIFNVCDTVYWEISVPLIYKFNFFKIIS